MPDPDAFRRGRPHVPPESVNAIRAQMGAWYTMDIHVYPGAEHGFNRFGYPSHNEAAAGLALEHNLAHFRRLLTWEPVRVTITASAAFSRLAVCRTLGRFSVRISP